MASDWAIALVGAGGALAGTVAGSLAGYVAPRMSEIARQDQEVRNSARLMRVELRETRDSIAESLDSDGWALVINQDRWHRHEGNLSGRLPWNDWAVIESAREHIFDLRKRHRMRLEKDAMKAPFEEAQGAAVSLDAHDEDGLARWERSDRRALADARAQIEAAIVVLDRYSTDSSERFFALLMRTLRGRRLTGSGEADPRA